MIFGPAPRFWRIWRSEARGGSTKAASGSDQNRPALSFYKTLRQTLPRINSLAPISVRAQRPWPSRNRADSLKDVIMGQYLLAVQEKIQKIYMQKRYPGYLLIEDIGSGLNFNRRGLRKIIKYAIIKYYIHMKYKLMLIFYIKILILN